MLAVIFFVDLTRSAYSKCFNGSTGNQNGGRNTHRRR